MEFTKEKTNIAKGIAICLMFANHLYAFPDRLLDGNYYIPLIPFIDVESYVGGFGSICVSVFIFLSGFGMFLGCSHSKKLPLQYSLRKLRDFYSIYWIYFLLFVPIGLIFFSDLTLWDSDQPRYSNEIPTFLLGFLGWSSRYDSEWWFVRVFIILLLLFPLYMKLVERNSTVLFLVSGIFFSVAWFLKVSYTGALGFLFWQIVFAVGILCSKGQFFSTSSISLLDQKRVWWCLPIIVICFLERLRFGAKLDFLFVPVFIYAAIRIIMALRLSRIFLYLGEYSFPLWLVHSFFCYYYLQDIIYFPRWSPLIFGLLTSFSLISVLLIEHVRSFIQQRYWNSRLK